jgi:DNA-binding NtrC family response regulator
MSRSIRTEMADLSQSHVGSDATALADRAEAEVVAVDPQTIGRTSFVANSAAMRGVRDLVRCAGASRHPVLIVGEPGSGRARLARAIHDELQPSRPFVLVDAGAAAGDLEHHVFGTTSRRSRPADAPEVIGAGNVLERAAGGTLVLSRVVEMPARAQARLGRILRDGEAQREVDGEMLDLDVRMIATDEPSIDAALADGRLRRDLYERLAHFRIDVPPYRARREDLPQLILQAARAHGDALGTPPKHFTRAALSLLSALPWRGNGDEVASLVGTLTRAVAGPVIDLDDVLAQAPLDGGAAPLTPGQTLRDARARFERDCISAVLQRHQGRIGDAARALGIQRTNLYRKVRQLNVARSLLPGRK